MRLISLILVMLLISPVISGAYAMGESGQSNEQVGDWIVTREKVVRDENITLQGNLKVVAGGITFINSTISIRCYIDGQYKVEVWPGAYLRLINSTIERAPGYHAYYIVSNPKSSVEMLNSSVKGAGYQEGERSGLYVQGGFTGINTTFSDNYFGLVAINGTGIDIKECTFQNELRGIYLQSCSKTRIENSMFERHLNESIFMKGGYDNSVVGCEINVSYGKNGTGIHAVNVEGLRIMYNSVNLTSMYGICVEGGDENTTVYGNDIGTAGTSQIELNRCRDMTIRRNDIGNSYQAIVIRDSENITIHGERIVNGTVGVRSYSSDVRLENMFFRNLKYAVFSCESRVFMSYVYWKDLQHTGFFRNSVVYSNSYMEAKDYYLRNDTTLYFYKYVPVKALSAHGNPLPNVKIRVNFMGEEVCSEITDSHGESILMSPYMMQTTKYGRNYSWCEARAYARHHFVENPIRYYSWDTDELLFQEEPKDLLVMVYPKPTELLPGDKLNITVKVSNDGAPVNNATLKLSLNGNETDVPVKKGDNGTYFLSVMAPDFNGTLIVDVEAYTGSLGGIGRTRVMEEKYTPPEEKPVEHGNEGIPNIYYYGALAGILALGILLLHRKRKKGHFEAFHPIPTDELEIKER